eukprot:8894647-Pyramimonas_sp.AAC.1
MYSAGPGISAVHKPRRPLPTAFTPLRAQKLPWELRDIFQDLDAPSQQLNASLRLQEPTIQSVEDVLGRTFHPDEQSFKIADVV